MASAAFTINGSASPVSVAAGATVTLALASTVGVRSVAWTAMGSSDSAVTTPTITPGGSPPGATATFAMPSPIASRGYAVLIRCVINGGVDAAGQPVDGYTATGIVGTVNAAGYLPFVVGERWERNATHGVANDMNAQIGAIGGSAAVVPSLVYRPGGTTSGNVYATEAELLAALPSAGVATVLLDGSANGGTVPIAQTWPLDSRIRLVARKTTTVTLTGKLVDPCYLEQLYVSADPAGASAIEFADTAPTFELRDCSLSSASASKPALLVEAGDTIKLVASGTTLITRDAYEVFDKDAGGRLFVWLRDEASIGDDTIRGTTSDEKPTRILLDSAAASASTTQTNLTGAVVVALEELASRVAFSLSEWTSTNVQAALQEAVMKAVADAASTYAPLSRTLTGAGGVLVGGDTSAHDLSADRTISLTYGSSASTVCEGNDSRLNPSAVAGDANKIVSVNGSGAYVTGLLADANVSATAAIAGTKITPNFGSQNVSTTGTLAAGATTLGGALTFGAAATATIAQSAPTSDVAPTATTITAASAWASAVTNRTGGDLVLQGGASISGATYEGQVRFKCGSTSLGAFVVNRSTGDAQFAVDAARTNLMFAADGASQSFIVSATGTGGTVLLDSAKILFRNAGRTEMARMMDAGGGAVWLQFVPTSIPTIKQNDTTTASATGATTTLQAQNATGTTSTGGALVLASGTGTTAAGAVSINAGATTRIKADATGIGFFGATPVAKPSVSGSKGSNAALASLCTQLASLGLITDSTT